MPHQDGMDGKKLYTIAERDCTKIPKYAILIRRNPSKNRTWTGKTAIYGKFVRIVPDIKNGRKEKQ